MKENRKFMVIGLNELGGAEWTGGITYRNNLIKALNLYNDKVEIVLLTKSDEFLDTNLRRLEIKNSNSKVFNKINSAIRKFAHKDLVIKSAIKKGELDILFPCQYSISKRTKSIYWIPDFQFLHLSNLYSTEQINKTKEKLLTAIKTVPITILSSYDAQKDFKDFAPEYLHKTHVLNFVAHVPQDLYNLNPISICSIYNLPLDFIYLPNQFWEHKNHLLVLDALKLLRDRGKKIHIVCSGNLTDTRNQKYFSNLIKKISEYNLREQFIIIGLIPHDHIYSLIRQSKCVLNPSLFEGWSTTVEETKSVGKSILLSDLNVHIEQNPPNAIFFERNNCEDLAEKLLFMWESKSFGPDLAMEQNARSKLLQRMLDFGNEFINICSIA